jgi:hypothetical protein
MSCGGIHADVLGALILSVGLVALMLGFYGGLFDRRERDGKALLAFVIGCIGVILGAWIMRAC